MGVQYKKITLPLIILLAFVLRAISLNQSLWLDEAINVLATTKYSFLGMITDYARADFHPPLHFIILWIWTKLFGITEIVVRIPSLIFGLCTVYMTYLIGKKLYSEKIGLLAGLLLAINPLHIFYTQEARMYSLAAFAVSINIYLFLKLINREKLNIFLFMFSNLAVLLSDYVAYLIFPAEFIFLLISQNKENIKKWLISIFGGILLGGWWVPVFLSQLDTGAIASSRLPTWKFVVGRFDLKSVPLTFVKFIIGRISLADKFLYVLLLLPVSALFAFLAYRGARRILVILTVIPIILGALISFVIPIYSYFRFLFLLPLFVILISLGLFSLKPRLRYIFLLIVILIESFSTSVYLFNPLHQREDWKGLVNFLKSKEKSESVLFESSGILPPFDYYAKGELNAKGALIDFPVKNSNSLIDLENLLKKNDSVYLVDYLVKISDPDRLVDSRLKELGFNISETKDFHGVGFLYHYVK